VTSLKSTITSEVLSAFKPGVEEGMYTALGLNS